MRRLRVLIADDHRLVLEAIRLALDGADDIEVVGAAESGSQVLPLVGQTGPDLVLLDVLMPGMDGLTALDLLRRRHPQVKVVMLSGVNEPDTIETALRHGASAFIAKQIEPRDLPSALRQIAQGTVYQMTGLPESRDQAAAKEAGLTERELSILKALGQGLSNKQIAKQIWVAEQTVKFHLTNIYRKLHVTNRTEAARYAYQHGLVESPAYEPAAASSS